MGAAAGHRLRLDDITHRFGEFVAASDVALDIPGGELVALLGPSVCGKSTLLRIMTQGRVLFDEVPVDHLPAKRRGVGIVFGLWPAGAPLAARSARPGVAPASAAVRRMG
jgi:putative spermidine/putrescine transport system ATP-binding protein